MKKKSWILTKPHILSAGIIFVSLLVRIFIIFWALNFRENTDILRWKDWARISYLHSFADTYKPDYLQFGTYPNNMPPGTLYTVSGVYWLWLQMGKIFAHVWHVIPGSNIWINGPFLTLLLRVPSILADIGITILLYVIVKRYSSSGKMAIVTSMLFSFSPVVLFNSTFMGQMDAINNLFFLLAILALLKNRYSWVAVGFALSLLIKFSLLFMILPFGYIIYQKTHSLGKLLRVIMIGILTTILSVIPISYSPISWYWNFFLRNGTGEMTNLTAFALNGWWMIFHPQVTFGPLTTIFSASEIRLAGSPFVDNLWLGIPLGLWATLIWFVICLPIVWGVVRFKKRVLEPKWIALVLGVFAVISYIWLPKMHDRYFYPAIPLLTLAFGLGAPVIFELVALTILNFINLFIVWHPISLSGGVYATLASSNFQWGISILTVLVAMILYIRAMRLMSSA